MRIVKVDIVRTLCIDVRRGREITYIRQHYFKLELARNFIGYTLSSSVITWSSNFKTPGTEVPC